MQKVKMKNSIEGELRGGTLLDPIQASALLSDYGIVSTPQAIVKGRNELASLNSRVGLPIALKLWSADLIHKSDAGGVKLSLRTEKELESAYDELSAIASSISGGSRILAQKMVTGSPELIVGAKRDPIFGPVLAFGIGGLLTEVYRDVSMCVHPWTENNIREMLDSIKGKALLEGYRGSKKVDKDGLASLINNIGRMMLERREISAIDLNPLIAAQDGQFYVVDSKILVSQQNHEPRPNSLARAEELNPLFNPTTIAVVEASDNPHKIAGMVVPRLIKFGFDPNKIYPVNPARDRVNGIKCYKGYDELPTSLDLACTAVPAQAVHGVLEKMGKKQTRSAIIFSTDFKDESTIKNIVEKYGMRICGPNCEGVFCTAANNFATFTAKFDTLDRLVGGNISIVTQSGSLLCYLGMSLMEQQTGLGKIVSIGNQTDLDVSDYLNYFAQDNQTKVVGFFLEGLTNGQKFVTAIQMLNKAGKPVVGLKVGNSQKAALSAKLHTGSLVGESDVYRTLFNQLGVTEAKDIEELTDLLTAFSLAPIPSGEKFFVISSSGGVSTAIIDYCQSFGIALTDLDEPTARKLSGLMPDLGLERIVNPLDVAINRDEIFSKILETVADKADIFLIVNGRTPPDSFLASCQPLISRGKTLIVFKLTSRGSSEEFNHYMRAHKIPVYNSPFTAIRAVDALIRYARFARRLQ